MKNKNKPYMLQKKYSNHLKFFAIFITWKCFRVYNNDLELDYEVGIGLDHNKKRCTKFAKKELCFFSTKEQRLIVKARHSHSCDLMLLNEMSVSKSA